MYALKRKACDDRSEHEPQQAKHHKRNPRFEQIYTFLSNYFSEENGRLEKLPNPRYGRQEFVLPTWLSKRKIYCVYVADCIQCKCESTVFMMIRVFILILIVINHSVRYLTHCNL